MVKPKTWLVGLSFAMAFELRAPFFDSNWFLQKSKLGMVVSINDPKLCAEQREPLLVAQSVQILAQRKQYGDIRIGARDNYFNIQ